MRTWLRTMGQAYIGRDFADIVNAIRNSDPQQLVDASSGAITARVSAVVLKALQKDPSERFQTAVEMTFALREARCEYDIFIS